MTDLTPSPDDALDELLSAVLDGEADEHERARVEGDPELQRRLEELRVVRDLVAQPVAPLDELTARRLRERAVADALSPGVGAAASAASASPARASGASVSRWSSWLDPRRLGAVAAMLLLVALAVPLARSLGNDNGNGDRAGDEAASTPMAGEESTSADSAEAEMFDSGTDDAGSGEADGGADESDTTGIDPADPSTPPDLGEAESDAELAERVDSAVVRSHAIEDEGPIVSPGDERPEDATCAPDAPGTLVATFTGRVEGEDRVVQLLEDDLGAPRVVVIDPETCEVLLRRP